MLRRCPLSRLKIDRGFVSGLGMEGALGSGSDRSDVVIVEAVLALGRGLGLGVVAEGVETEAQAAFLAVLPSGGQDRALRNAWAARSSDTVRARERGDAGRALARAAARAAAPVGGTGAAGR